MDRRTHDPDDPDTLDLDAEATTPEERQRLLAETVALADVHDAHYRQPVVVDDPDPPWRGPLAAVLFAAAVWVFLAPPGWVQGGPDPVVTAGDLDRGVHAAVAIQAQEIEAFRHRHGRLPDSLDEIAFRFDGVSYIRSNSRVYQLVATASGGETVLYDSARPDPAFAESVPRGGR